MGGLALFVSRWRNNRPPSICSRIWAARARHAEFVATPGLARGRFAPRTSTATNWYVWLGYGPDEGLLEGAFAGSDAALRRRVGAKPDARASRSGPRVARRFRPRSARCGRSGSARSHSSAGDAINQAEAARRALDAKQPEQALVRWRQRAIGLELIETASGRCQPAGERVDAVVVLKS